MNDLISRQAAIERATKDHDFFKGATIPTDKARRDELLNVMCWLRELPSAQPEIILCKDCKHYADDQCDRYADETLGYVHSTQADGYCWMAERKEE